MIRHLLSGTDILVPQLSFGTASLHHLWSRKERQNILSTAIDMGITHFDTAPYYGFGIAEQEIGHFLRGSGSEVTIATKIGLYSPRSYSSSILETWSRKLLGKVYPTFSLPIADWSVKKASKSLDQSLKVLGVDRIDILLLHEPRFELLSTDELLSWLYSTKTSGKIGTWGLAGNLEDMLELITMESPLSNVLQIRDSINGNVANLLNELNRPFGYLADRTQNSLARGDILRLALERNNTGSIIVSSRKPKHLVDLVRAVEK